MGQRSMFDGVRIKLSLRGETIFTQSSDSPNLTECLSILGLHWALN